MSQNQSTAPETPKPLPRSGIRDSDFGKGFLYICLLLSTALVGVGIAAMRTTSPEEVRIAEAFCGVGLVLLLIYFWRVSRTALGSLLLLALVGGVLAYTTNSLLPTGVLCGLVFAISEGSVLIALLPRGKGVLIPLIPILAYAVTAAVSRDLVGSVGVLIPYPPMLALGLGTRRSAESEEGPNRVGVICSASLALGLSMGGMLLLSAIRHLGTSDLSLLSEAAREGLLDYLLSIEIPAELPAETREYWGQLLAYDTVKTVVDSTFNILPALYTVAVMAIILTCQSLQFGTLRAYGLKECLTERVRELRMSSVSCVVFTAAYLVAVLDRNVITPLSTIVAQNVYIILLPGLALSGTIRLWRGFLKTGHRAMGCLFYLVILIPCFLVVYPIIPAGLEVLSRLITAIIRKFNTKDDEDDPFGNAKK